MDNETFRVFLVASVIPDIDAITIFLGLDAILKYHGTITHSFFTAFVFAALVALLLGSPRSFPYAIFGAYLHIAIDILSNTAMIFKGGVQCLWPLSNVKCLLLYHLPIPVNLILGGKIILTILLYGTIVYYIQKKDYPWAVWR